MHIICKSCGHPNTMGHMFCTECSDKLDLENVGEHIDQEHAAERRHDLLKFMWIPVILIFLAIAALCAWPHKAHRSSSEERGSYDRINTIIRVLDRVAQKRGLDRLTVRPPLREIDINAWFAKAKRDYKVRSMTAKLNDGSFTLRAVDTFGPFCLFDTVNIPKLPFSYQITGKPKAGDINITSAKFGHLPLFGPATKLIESKFKKLFKKNSREKAILKITTDIIVTEGELVLTAEA